MSAEKPDILRGVVVAVMKKFSDTSIRLLNNEYDTPVVRNITLYNPLIKDVTVLQRAFIHQGKKRVKRTRIYYMESKDPKLFTVPYANNVTLDDPFNIPNAKARTGTN